MFVKKVLALVECALSGNKGEWSEAYVLLKALGDGRIYSADGNVKKKPDSYFEVNHVTRHDSSNQLEFIREPEKEAIRVLRNGTELCSVPTSEFIDQYRRLFAEINSSKSAFSVPETEKFLINIGCTTLKAPSRDKTDITINIRESDSETDITRGFSIKSMLGNSSTLVNASGSTNFIYTLKGPVTRDIACRANEYRNGKSKTKLVDELTYLKNQGISLEFTDTENKVFYNNLTQIHPQAPFVFAEMVKMHYQGGISKLSEQTDILDRKDPLKIGGENSTIYADIVKKMLTSWALGMLPATPWSGVEDQNGGYIIVKDDGDILCYRIRDKESFGAYLLRNTKFETPSIKKHDYADVYSEGNDFRLKLNLQIRFI